MAGFSLRFADAMEKARFHGCGRNVARAGNWSEYGYLYGDQRRISASPGDPGSFARRGNVHEGQQDCADGEFRADADFVPELRRLSRPQHGFHRAGGLFPARLAMDQEQRNAGTAGHACQRQLFRRPGHQGVPRATIRARRRHQAGGQHGGHRQLQPMDKTIWFRREPDWPDADARRHSLHGDWRHSVRLQGYVLSGRTRSRLGAAEHARTVDERAAPAAHAEPTLPLAQHDRQVEARRHVSPGGGSDENHRRRTGKRVSDRERETHAGDGSRIRGSAGNQRTRPNCAGRRRDDGSRRIGAADCLCESGESAAGAIGEARERNQHPLGHGSEPRQVGAPVADRERGACVPGRSCGPAGRLLEPQRVVVVPPAFSGQCFD